MTQATASFIKRELGNLNDLEISRVIDLEPTEAQVLEACAWLDGDEEAMRSLKAPSSATVEMIVNIARAAQDAEDEPDPVLG